VDASFQNINAVIQHIRAGKMRALAVTSPRRSPVLPDLPTLAEAGVKNVEVASWQAIVAPKGLPPALRDKAHAAFVEALN
ncbi:tripartite tricarboxylate transporter substrate binding protein, partial [Escherichia coli]